MGYQTSNHRSKSGHVIMDYLYWSRAKGDKIDFSHLLKMVVNLTLERWARMWLISVAYSGGNGLLQGFFVRSFTVAEWWRVSRFVKRNNRNVDNMMTQMISVTSHLLFLILSSALEFLIWIKIMKSDDTSDLTSTQQFRQGFVDVPFFVVENCTPDLK